MEGFLLTLAQTYGPWAVAAFLGGLIFWQKLTRIERTVLALGARLDLHEKECARARADTLAYRSKKDAEDRARDREIQKLNRKAGLNGQGDG